MRFEYCEHCDKYECKMIDSYLLENDIEIIDCPDNKNGHKNTDIDMLLQYSDDIVWATEIKRISPLPEKSLSYYYSQKRGQDFILEKLKKYFDSFPNHTMNIHIIKKFSVDGYTNRCLDKLISNIENRIRQEKPTKYSDEFIIMEWNEENKSVEKKCGVWFSTLSHEKNKGLSFDIFNDFSEIEKNINIALKGIGKKFINYSNYNKQILFIIDFPFGFNQLAREARIDYINRLENYLLSFVYYSIEVKEEMTSRRFKFVVNELDRLI
ncbi:MAG: hypothetical protein E7206_14505 [Clostridium beijerinckii]|nr:hypothetical protein [Clostridium beijerinckii]